MPLSTLSNLLFHLFLHLSCLAKPQYYLNPIVLSTSHIKKRENSKQISYSVSNLWTLNWPCLFSRNPITCSRFIPSLSHASPFSLTLNTFPHSCILLHWGNLIIRACPKLTAMFLRLSESVHRLWLPSFHCEWTLLAICICNI